MVEVYFIASRTFSLQGKFFFSLFLAAAFVEIPYSLKENLWVKFLEKVLCCRVKLRAGSIRVQPLKNVKKKVQSSVTYFFSLKGMHYYIGSETKIQVNLQSYIGSETKIQVNLQWQFSCIVSFVKHFFSCLQNCKCGLY